jgi:hypothetical protein
MSTGSLALLYGILDLLSTVRVLLNSTGYLCYLGMRGTIWQCIHKSSVGLVLIMKGCLTD